MTNILFILVDDMRYDHMPFLPKTRLRMQNAQKYEACRLNVPICQGARTGFLLGQDAKDTGMYLNTDVPSTGQWNDTIAKRLDDVGISCAHFGKMALGAQASAKPGWDFRRSFATNEQSAYNYTIFDGTSSSTPTSLIYQTDYLTSVFGTFLAGASQPWMAWMCPSNPHVDTVGFALQARYSDIFAYEKYVWPIVELIDESTKPSWIQALSPLSTNKKTLIQQGAIGQLRELVSVDLMVDNMFTLLEFYGMLNDTIVIFCSDNGVMYGEQQIYGNSPAYKNVPYEASARVPLWISGPGITAGSNDVPVSIQDITYTMADFWGASKTGYRGSNLFDIMNNPQNYTNKAVLYEREGGNTVADPPDPPNGSGVFTRLNGQHWKLIRYDDTSPATDQYEMYNVTSDPDEQTNLAFNGSYLSTRNALEAILNSLL